MYIELKYCYDKQDVIFRCRIRCSQTSIDRYKYFFNISLYCSLGNFGKIPMIQTKLLRIYEIPIRLLFRRESEKHSGSFS